jgi:hypothetical protein
MMHMICSFLRHSKSLTHPEKMATLYMDKGKRVIQLKYSKTEYKEKESHPTSLEVILNNKDPRDGLHTNESHPTSLEVIQQQNTKIQSKADGLQG